MPHDVRTAIAEALCATLISPNVTDRNLEAANVVDVLSEIGLALWKLARTDDPESCGALEAHGDVLAAAIERSAEALASGLYAIAGAIAGRQEPPHA